MPPIRTATSDSTKHHKRDFREHHPQLYLARYDKSDPNSNGIL
jgi:hypothetical protein